MSLTKGLFYNDEEMLREPVRDGEALRAFTSPKPELAAERSCYYQTPARAIAFN